MDVAVSPYHLTTREAPAMAALLLADRVFTMLPTPLDEQGAESAQGATCRVPEYLAFMKSWAWTAPLWKRGVIFASFNGEPSIAEMHDVSARISEVDDLAPLRPFLRTALYEDERSYLGAVAADMLKGGPDPGISVPVSAGIDRFATRHGLIVARSNPTSIVQLAEASLGTPHTAVAVPFLAQADGNRLLHAREVLHDALSPLRSRLQAMTRGGGDAGLADAAATYCERYSLQREDILEGAGDDEVRVIEGTATITPMTLPSDAVLRSSIAAVTGIRPGARSPAKGCAPAFARGIQRETGSDAPREARTNGSPAHLPALYDAVEGKSFLTILVKPLGAPRPRR